jgi:uncharacterized protein YjiS (DUF1127 family)
MSYALPGPRDCCPPTTTELRPQSAAAFDFLDSLLRWLADQGHRRTIIRELQRLDDRLLCDIGISRGEIEAFTDAMLTAHRQSQQAAGRR